MRGRARGDRGDFTTFVRDTEPRLLHALIAHYGPVDGREATVDALSWAWENWSRLADVDNKLGYLYRVGQSATRRFASRPVPLMLHLPVAQLAPDIDPGLVRALAQLVDTASGEIRQLAGYHPYDLEWRPGTDELAITGDVPVNEHNDASIDIYTVSTGQIRTLGDAQADSLTWSPDGTTLAFTHGENSADRSIWLIDADGTDMRLLTNETVGSLHGIGPVWSPRGDLIAYQRRIGCCESSEVVLVTATDDDPANPLGTKTVIPPPQTTAWDEVYPRNVTWTPDGTHLVYLGWGGGFDESVLVIVPIDSSQSPIVLGDGIDAPSLPIQMMSGTGPLT